MKFTSHSRLVQILLVLGITIILALTATRASAAVTVSSVAASWQAGQVVITWQTKTEINNVGFNVLRSTSNKGTFTQINTDLIPGCGGCATGAPYSYTDSSAVTGQSYYYELQSVSNSGSTQNFGPVPAAGGASAPTATATATARPTATHTPKPSTTPRPTATRTPAPSSTPPPGATSTATLPPSSATPTQTQPASTAVPSATAAATLAATDTGDSVDQTAGSSSPTATLFARAADANTAPTETQVPLPDASVTAPPEPSLVSTESALAVDTTVAPTRAPQVRRVPSFTPAANQSPDTSTGSTGLLALGVLAFGLLGLGAFTGLVALLFWYVRRSG